jgi:hypothetical protein
MPTRKASRVRPVANAEQFARRGVGGAGRGLSVETLRLHLHALRQVAHRFQPERAELPNRPVAAEPANIVAAD